MKQPAQDTGKIARSAGTVSAAVMCSRVLGLIREQVFAALFGAGFAYDAFVVAFRIPNLLRDLFAEGALSSAFVAVFTDYNTKKGENATWLLAGNVMVFMAILLSVLVALGIFFTEPIIRLLAPDFSLVPGKVELTKLLTITMFPFLLFISIAAIVMGILNTRGRFFVPAMASSFFNLGSIVGGGSLALLFPRIGQPAILGMAIGTLIGGMLQLGMQLPSLKAVGFRFVPNLDLKDPGLKRILRLMVPAIIGLSATQFNIFINTFFASSCQEGSVSWLNYSFRLVQFPIGVFGVAVSIATLPLISRYAAIRDFDNLKESYVSSLILGLCLTIPATVGLVLLAEPVVRLIFEHGAFTAFDTIMTSEALSLYVVGLFAYASVKIMVPVFYALDNTRYPVIGSFLAVGMNIVVILLTIDAFQHRAIALSTSVAMICNFVFLSIVLYRKLAGYSLRYLAAGVGKIVAASTVMGGWIFWSRSLCGRLLATGFFSDLATVMIVIGSSVVVYVLTLYVVRLHELTVLVDKFRTRLGTG